MNTLSVLNLNHQLTFSKKNMQTYVEMSLITTRAKKFKHIYFFFFMIKTTTKKFVIFFILKQKQVYIIKN